jgi:hypothetical protein
LFGHHPPEFCRDPDGRWIGVPESVRALTTTLEYRAMRYRLQTIVARSTASTTRAARPGGSFSDGDTAASLPRLVPTQHMLALGLIITFEGVVPHRN